MILSFRGRDRPSGLLVLRRSQGIVTGQSQFIQSPRGNQTGWSGQSTHGPAHSANRRNRSRVASVWPRSGSGMASEGSSSAAKVLRAAARTPACCAESSRTIRSSTVAIAAPK
jgi:hypothetical protein